MACEVSNSWALREAQAGHRLSVRYVHSNRSCYYTPVMPLFIPESHQIKSIRRLLDQPHCSLFSMPGSGKSATALSVIKIVNKPALIIAPLQPALISWPREIEKWLQFRHLDFAVAHGKNREQAFEHFLTIMNPEGLGWLDNNKHLVRDKKILFVDESHRFFLCLSLCEGGHYLQ